MVRSPGDGGAVRIEGAVSWAVHGLHLREATVHVQLSWNPAARYLPSGPEVTPLGRDQFARWCCCVDRSLLRMSFWKCCGRGCRASHPASSSFLLHKARRTGISPGSGIP